MEKKTWGGKRPGSGRKPAGQRIARQITLPPSVWQAIDEVAQSHGMDRSHSLHPPAGVSLAAASSWLMRLAIKRHA